MLGADATMLRTEPGFRELPDELVVAVMAQMTLLERHHTLPLVCRRFDRLVNSPSLLACLKLNVSLQSELRGWRSFCHWLMQRAAGQVQRLDLTADGEEDCTAEDGREVVCMMAACVVACCTAGGLTELRWYAAEYDVRLGGWVAALRGLTRLDMTVHDSDLELAASLHILTDLQQLKIDGRPAEAWHPAVRLPASLTKLHLNCHMGHASLPHQLRDLTRLRTLNLVDSIVDAGGYDALLALPELRRLKMVFGRHLPSCLSQLTQLTSLYIELTPFQGEEPAASIHMEEALEPLSRLRSLFLFGQHSPPDALGGLSQLEELSWGSHTPLGAQLPAGTWLNRLRRLSLPASLVAGSVRALAAAWHLETLRLCFREERANAHRQAAAVRWAARHPPLRQLYTRFQGRQVALEVHEALMEARGQNPYLTFGRGKFQGQLEEDYSDSASDEEFN